MSTINQSRNLCTYDTPPEALKLNDAPLRPRGRAANTASSLAAPANAPPSFPYPFYPFAPPMPWAIPSSAPPAGRSSSPSGHGIEDPTVYPRIGPWLQDLDHGPRGADNRNFQQFAPFFEQEGYCQIIELQKETAETLRGFCPGMNRGTAIALLSYAEADIQSAQRDLRREQKRARRYL